MVSEECAVGNVKSKVIPFVCKALSLAIKGTFQKSNIEIKLKESICIHKKIADFFYQTSVSCKF